MKVQETKGGIKVLVVILILLIILAAALLAIKVVNTQKEKQEKQNQISSEEPNLEPEEPEKIEKQIQIYSGNERPIAVMIDNHTGAWPQAGLNDAYLVYEIIVEGGETRLMPIFKEKDLEKIGPVRSARHYFLDYALENDAIYVHFGQSPQAGTDIKKYSVSDINGLVESESDFWRVKDKYAPHNVVTNTQKIMDLAKGKGYRTISTQSSVLHYVADEVELDSDIPATRVTIPYCSWNVVEYRYDEVNKRYIRYSKGEKQKDWETDMDITTKNIIITFAKNSTLEDGEDKDRQTLSNIGTLDGYYITNGKAIRITCEKKSRTEKTIYRDEDGNEIQVNDGNTYIPICPIDAKVVIE